VVDGGEACFDGVVMGADKTPLFSHVRGEVGSPFDIVLALSYRSAHCSVPSKSDDVVSLRKNTNQTCRAVPWK